MAGPTSASVGLKITTGLLALLLLFSFLGGILAFGRWQAAQAELKDFQHQVGAIIAPGEDSSDRVQRFLQAKAGGQSLVDFLTASYEQAMTRTLGAREATPAEFTQRLSSIPGADAAPLVPLLEQARRRGDDEASRAAAASAAQTQAQSDLEAAMQRIAQIERDHTAELDAKDNQIAQYRGELDGYHTDVQATIDRNNQRVEDIRRAATAREASLQNEIARLEQDILVQRDMIEQLRGERQAAALKPQDEATLVDAQVVSVNAAEGVLFLNVGRKQHVVLGMTFEIYNDAAAIKPDAQGEYQPGKASVEIIRINETSSAARILRQARGAPLVEGDVAANALYDPDKTYTFLVFGLFDADHDGAATPQEAGAVEALIQEWGGAIAKELTGAVDFVVLGERPVLPPEPPLDSPPAVMRNYISRRQLVDRYDELFRTSAQTNIPVLNLNRLYTLTGLHARR